MIRRVSLSALSLVFAACMATPALAHPGHAGHDLGAGFWHPITGLDHLLAMIAVGLLAAQLGGRALWAVPSAFVGAMALGGIAGSLGAPLPGVEMMILASVLVLGGLVAAARSLPLVAACSVAAAFAFFHGHAHAVEMAANGSFGLYGAGFLMATALLHAAGVFAGLLLVRDAQSRALRLAGGAISAASLLLLAGVI